VATRYGFVHALYADVAYERVLAGRRAEMHQRIGQRLETAYGARGGEVAARLWPKRGKEREARDRLAAIYGWFTEGFDDPDLREARALLDELA